MLFEQGDIVRPVGTLPDYYELNTNIGTVSYIARYGRRLHPRIYVTFKTKSGNTLTEVFDPDELEIMFKA